MLEKTQTSSENEEIREKVKVELKEKKNRYNFGYENVCHRLKMKLLALKILKQLKRKSLASTKRPILNCEFSTPCDNRDILNYANEEITDLDDDTLSTRRDFFVFMGMIRPMKHTLYLVNSFYCKEESKHTGTTLLPPEYVEKVYDVKLRNPQQYYAELHKEFEIWEKLGPENHDERVRKCVLIAYHEAVNIMSHKDIINRLKESRLITKEQYTEAIRELENPNRTINAKFDVSSNCDAIYDKAVPNSESQKCDINKSQNETAPPLSLIDSNVFSPIPDNLPENNVNEINRPTSENSIVEHDSGITSLSFASISPTQQLSSEEFVTQILNSELRISVDEGICAGSGKSSPGIPKLSELGPLEKSILNPKVQLIDFCAPLTDADKQNMKFKVYEQSMNMFYIDAKYIEHSAEFSLPANMFQSKVPLTFNFLKLPEIKLRRRCEFALPMEYKEV